MGVETVHKLDSIGLRMVLPARAIVFREDAPAKAVYIVCEGQLKLSAMSREGKVMIVRLAAPGDLLGLSAMLNHTAHEVTAETLAPTVLKKIANEDFANFLHRGVEAGEKTSQAMARECREIFLDARRLALSGSAAGKLARLLLDWARNVACELPDMSFTMALTHEELASMTGTSRETITRLLSRFGRERLILRQGSRLRILAPEKLELLAD